MMCSQLCVCVYIYISVTLYFVVYTCKHAGDNYNTWNLVSRCNGPSLIRAQRGLSILPRYIDFTIYRDSAWLASSFVQFSPYRNGIQNFLGDTFGGTVYPEDISCGGT